jgi:protein tyrosine phosphatase (PTP) superfamily phosphohydrolase (DUF442 family)
MAFLYAPLMSHGPIEQVTPNLMRGPDPKVADIYALRDNGVKTIISLRTNPERKKQELCKKLGMKWVQIKTGVFKTPTDEQFDEFRQIVDDPKNQPCYASCEIDMDRTGVYIAAYRMTDQHWTTQQMVDEFTSHHQKKWWPVFRKYEGKVVAYAKKRNAPGADTQLSSTLSTSAQQLAPTDKAAAGRGTANANVTDMTQTKAVVSNK